MRVFGSVARDEETESSDIDFLIDYDLSKISPWFPVRLIRDLEAMLGRKVDVVTENGLKERKLIQTWMLYNLQIIGDGT